MKFIIYTYSFDINSGGTIVLHQLCHILNQEGYEASLWIHKKPPVTIKKPFRSLFRQLKYLQRKRFKTHKYFNTPIASTRDLEDAIVIYPETISGNPLQADKVVRWLLHKPGFHSGKIDFSPDDLIVGFGEKFSTLEYPIIKDNVLNIFYIMSDIYKQRNFLQRTGSCHMIRKGKGKTFVHDKDSILVDSFSHQEMSEIFNKVEFFISYDPYTYYSTYASLCGCKSIIIPDTGVAKEQWQPNIKDTYGLAYGINDLEYIDQTKELMYEYIENQQDENIRSVKNFATKCLDYFANSN